MKLEQLEKLYLCGIGSYGEIHSYQVGSMDTQRELFNFPNGAYSPTELSYKPRGSNATYVISAVCLADIDDAGKLDVGSYHPFMGKDKK